MLQLYKRVILKSVLSSLEPRWWRSGLERSLSIWKVGCSNPSRDRPKSYKQVVTAPLPNARQYVCFTGPRKWPSKLMSCVRVGVARLRTLTAHWPWVPSIGENLQPFTGKSDFSICVKNSRVGRKTPNKQSISSLEKSAWHFVWINFNPYNW